MWLKFITLIYGIYVGGFVVTRFYLLSNTKIIIKKNRNYRIFVPTSHKKSSVFRSAGLRMTYVG